MEEISLSIFGTTDYESVLQILPSYDGAVRRFWQEVNNKNKSRKEVRTNV